MSCARCLRTIAILRVSLEDFFFSPEEDPSISCMVPLQIVNVEPGRELLVISCSYVFKGAQSGGALERLSIDPESLEFWLFEAAGAAVAA